MTLYVAARVLHTYQCMHAVSLRIYHLLEATLSH